MAVSHSSGTLTWRTRAAAKAEIWTRPTPGRIVVLLALAAGLAVGVWALAVRLGQGLSSTWLTSITPWGAWVAFYIFFVGLSAGAFLLSSAVYVLGRHDLEPVGREALVVAILSMGAALGFIALDLGRIDRALAAFFFWNPTSVLAWEMRFYILYVAILAAELWLSLRAGRDARARRWLKVLGISGIPIAIFGVHGGTGLLFAVLKARPLWNSGLYPVLFVVSALVSGTALVTLLYALRPVVWRRNVDRSLLSSLSRTLLAFLAVEGGLELFEYLVAAYRGEPLEGQALRLMWSGDLAWLFWGVQVLLGMVVPTVILLRRPDRPAAVAAGAGLVIAGILAVRFNIVLPQMLAPVMEGLPAGVYLPSAVEWGASLGILSAFTGTYLASGTWLPLHDGEATDAGREDR
ncbi:MAG: polysulfide reductase NrfD [Limnochordaceae bacterium]|nr:polysulfide reductase NrfD [Limnochordaceae bacterium]